MTPQQHWRHGYLSGLCVGMGIALAFTHHWIGVVVFAALVIGIETWYATVYFRKERP